MTRLITIIALLFSSVVLSAQDDGPFNIYVNWHANASATVSPSPAQSRFENKDLRLEMKGNLTDKLFYRIRQQLTKPMTPGTLDHFSKGTDFMMVGWHATDKLSFMIGKQCQFHGGFEYELNPIFVYDYSDYLERMSIFHAGITMAWQPLPTQEFVAMMTTSSNDRFTDTHSTYSDSPAPFEYILNWNSSFFDGLLLGRWSVAAASMAEGAWSRFILGGEKICLPKFQIFGDFMACWDDIDRLEYASEDGARYLLNGFNPCFENVFQKSFVVKAEWQFAEGWNLWAKGMYETVSVRDVAPLHNYRKSAGYMGGLEYYPFDGQNLRFYLAWIGRHVSFSEASGLQAFDRNRIELGLMCRLKLH
ncbi:MAG: porin [Bacteroidales bacterium]|nr:porin [Bacteroidales bacterium]